MVSYRKTSPQRPRSGSSFRYQIQAHHDIRDRSLAHKDGDSSSRSHHSTINNSPARDSSTSLQRFKKNTNDKIILHDFHALSSVLSGPNVKPTIPHPSTRDIPPVKLADLPQPDTQLLEKYLENLKSLNIGKDILPTKETEKSTRSLSYVSNLEKETTNLLESIPSIFSDPVFHLENPSIFHSIIPLKQDSSDVSSEKNSNLVLSNFFTNHAMLLEKFAWYLDIVEIHLVAETEKACDAFFEQIGSLNKIEADASTSVQQLRKFRDELEPLSAKYIENGLQIDRDKIRKRNLTKLKESLSDFLKFDGLFIELEKNYQEGKYENTLPILGEIRKSLEDKETELNPKLKVLVDIRSKLECSQKKIVEDCTNHLTDCLLKNIETDGQPAIFNSALKKIITKYGRGVRVYNTDDSNELCIFSESISTFPLREIVERDVSVLQALNSLKPALEYYRSSVQKLFRSFMRFELQNENDSDLLSKYINRSGYQNNKNSPVTQDLLDLLRMLSPDQFFEIICRIYTQVCVSLKRLSIQVKILLDILSFIPKEERTEEDGFAFEISLNDLVAAASDITISRINKIIHVRSNQLVQYRSIEFKKLFGLTEAFLTTFEHLSGRQGQKLQANILAHCREHHLRYREDTLQDLARQLAMDNWEAVRVSTEIQDLVNDLEAAKIEEPVKWKMDILSEEDLEQEKEKKSKETDDKEDVDRLKSGNLQLSFDGKQLYIGISMFHFLTSIQQLAKWIFLAGHVLPVEIITTIFECLNLFNARLKQLILGAGATRSAGLRSILAKHMALASQALDVAITVSEILQSICSRTFPSSQRHLTSEIDKIRSDMASHQGEIDKKLVDILADRLQNSMHILQNTQTWNEQPENVSPYIASLMKDCQKLAKVLILFFGPKMRGILDNVLSLIESELLEVYQTSYIPEMLPQIKLDIAHFSAVATEIGLPNYGHSLLAFIEEKRSAKPPN